MLIVPTLLLMALALLALSLPHHFRLFRPAIARNPQRFRPLAFRLRLSGYTLMTVSMALAAHHWGWALGLTYWCGWLALTSVAVALSLSAWEQRCLQATKSPHR